VTNRLAPPPRPPRPVRAPIRATVALVALALVLPTTRAEAADDPPPPEPRPTGLRLGLRSGVAVPVGQAYEGSGALGDTVAATLPLRVDAGLRLASHVYLGLIGQYGLLFPGDCPAGATCSGSQVRLAGLVALHALPRAAFDPWIGVGAGFEWLSVTRAIAGSEVDLSMRGAELFDLELGVDWRPTPKLRLGPVLSTSLGRYTRVTVNGVPTRDFDGTTHAWIMGAFRVATDL